ncbi:MAG: peptidoglycan DD-metalloendopeptidase family protein [Pseudomonadota bacterium]
MRSVCVPARGASRLLRLSCLVSLSALLGACSVNSDRFSSLTNTTSDTQAPIVDPLPPQSAPPLQGDNYNRSVQSSSLGGPAVSAPPAALPRGAVADASGTVSVNRGDTLYSIARANNVHVKDLIAANNLQPPYHLTAGQRIQMPRDNYGQTRVASNSTYSPEPAYAAPQQSNAASTGTHRVQSGETLYSLGRKYNLHPHSIASANGLSNTAGLTVGQVINIPSGSGSGNFPSTVVKSPSTSKPSVVSTQPAPAPRRPVVVEKVPPVPTAEPRKTAEAKPPLPKPEQRSSSRFRWPLNGRVISTFGPKPSGSRNDGINIAVPEGTSVRAAENGVVAYAGNELKGYGNLVLVRHDGGWVTAYAHNKELFVKRGDRVTRGRVIAKSGSTGSVSSPQLHFELRKGADAVDPMKYLSSTKVAGG